MENSLTFNVFLLLKHSLTYFKRINNPVSEPVLPAQQTLLVQCASREVSSIEMAAEAEGAKECHVCQVEITKPRNHYGGISCYSCRAFFRRRTQKENIECCEFERDCNIQRGKGGRSRSCGACRYNKCLR